MLKFNLLKGRKLTEGSHHDLHIAYLQLDTKQGELISVLMVSDQAG